MPPTAGKDQPPKILSTEPAGEETGEERIFNV
jgi:hypothetical protein